MTAIRVIDNHNELLNSGVYTHAQIDTFISGSRQLITGSGIILTDYPSTRELKVEVDKNYILSIFSFQETPNGLNDGINKDFILSSPPTPSPSLMLYVNGILQAQGLNSDYTLSGSIVSLFTPPRSGSNIFAFYPK